MAKSTEQNQSLTNSLNAIPNQLTKLAHQPSNYLRVKTYPVTESLIHRSHSLDLYFKVDTIPVLFYVC